MSDEQKNGKFLLPDTEGLPLTRRLDVPAIIAEIEKMTQEDIRLLLERRKARYDAAWEQYEKEVSQK